MQWHGPGLLSGMLSRCTVLKCQCRFVPDVFEDAFVDVSYPLLGFKNVFA